MKKFLSILVALLLLVTPVLALAEAFTSEAVGIAFETPEGMNVSEDTNAHTGLAQVYVIGEAVVYSISAGEKEELAGIDLATADAAQLEQVVAVLGLGAEEGESPVSFEVIADGEVAYLSVTNEAQTGYATVELSDGYVYIQAIVSVSGEALDDDALAAFEGFLATIEFLN